MGRFGAVSGDWNPQFAAMPPIAKLLWPLLVFVMVVIDLVCQCHSPVIGRQDHSVGCLHNDLVEEIAFCSLFLYFVVTV